MAAWAVLFMGGFLTTNVLLITQASLNRTAVLYVLMPGTAIGLLLMLVGAVGIHFSKKAREQTNLGVHKHGQ